MLSKPPSTHPAFPRTRRGIGLTLLTRTRNPSRLARALFLAPALAPHTFLSGAPADALGETLGDPLVDPAYFFTAARWREHRRGLGLPEEPLPPGHSLDEDGMDGDGMPMGTVGAVALDVRGCIAVVTSTGGRTNKLVGRVGDTPVMGAGFWAEEWVLGWVRRTWDRVVGKSGTRAVGVSGTGDGDVRFVCFVLRAWLRVGIVFY
jgi:beta-aspartyl-peptidase (threonine type)